MRIDIGMSRAGLLDLAAAIRVECDAHPDDEGIEIVREVENNGGGEFLELRFGNDDMERSEVTAETAYYEVEQ